MKFAAAVIGAALAGGTPAWAQDHHHGGMVAPAMPMAAPSAPYAGMQQRAIKALSEQEIADLKSGLGMGLALAAELNFYPGPAHVLEMADHLGLSPEQRTRTAALFTAMKQQAIPLGERLIDEEAALDRLFADGPPTEAQIVTAVGQISTTQGELRVAHLRYHLMMRELLSPAQAAEYAKLRGYASP